MLTVEALESNPSLSLDAIYTLYCSSTFARRSAPYLKPKWLLLVTVWFNALPHRLTAALSYYIGEIEPDRLE